MDYTNSMAKISVFLPKSILELLEGGKDFTIKDGIVLFCDVAGFTPLTETLSKIGKEGSEQLTAILNNYFSEMINIIHSYNGDVLRFGGDAMTVFFDQELLNESLICACKMMKKMEEFKEIRESGTTFSLSMKIGISEGKVIFGIVGKRGNFIDYYCAGLPLDQSAESEHKAEKGEIILHPSLANKFRNNIKFKEDGFGKVVSFLEDLKGKKFFSVNYYSKSEEMLLKILPKHLLERAGEGTLGEHRATTVIFLAFSDIPLPSDEEEVVFFHSKVDTLYNFFFEMAKNFGGTINKIDMGDKGMKAIILFGSPYAIEKKEEMAVRCAIELKSNNPLKGEIFFKMGITTSHLFSGPVGSNSRREFTVMGDGINTAARLMQNSGWDQILCDEITKQAASTEILFRDLPPIRLKGKEKEVSIYSPEFLKRQTVKIDRENIIERDKAIDLIKKVLLHNEKPLLLLGESGLGKTTLVEYARQEAKKLNLLTARVFLAPYHTTRPFSLWKGLLRGAIGANKEDSAEQVKTLLKRFLSKEEFLYSSLLNLSLGLSWEETDSIKNLSPKDRKDLTFALIEKILESSQEMVLIADNLENSDPMSLEFLSFILQGGKSEKLKIIASSRKEENIERIKIFFNVLELTPFTKEGERFYLENVRKIDNLSKNSFNFFRSKSLGNPKYINALINMLLDEKIILSEGQKFYFDEDRLFKSLIPQNIEEFYLKKIDDLNRNEREIIQCASVLGYSVSLYLLSQITERSKEDLFDELQKLSEKGIFLYDSWGERTYFRFKDGFLRDAVYETAPFSLKKNLHQKCARLLEREAGENSKVWQLIAIHYKGAGEKEKAIFYEQKCAYDALSRYDNVTAMKYLEEVCSEEISVKTLDCAFNLVKVYGILGKGKDEENLIKKIEEKNFCLDSAKTLQLLLFKIKWFVIKGEFDRAENLFEAAENYAKKFNEIKYLAEIYINKAGGFYGPKGELNKAKEALSKSLNLPNAKEIEFLKITALFNYAIILRHEGKSKEAYDTFKKAYLKALRARLLPQLAMIANNIAQIKYDEREYSVSLNWLTKARKAAETFGLRNLLLLIEHLNSIIDLSRGNSMRAKERLEKNIENCRRLKNKFVEAISLDALVETSFLNLDLNNSFLYGQSSLNLSYQLKNGIIFKGTLIEIIKIFFSLGEKNKALDFVKKNKADIFISKNPPNKPVDIYIDLLFEYLNSSEIEFKRSLLNDISERLLPDYLFLFLEKFVEEENYRMCKEMVELIFSQNGIFNYFLNKIKIYFFLAKMGDKRSEHFAKDVFKMLKKSPYGVYGLRAIYYLWLKEKKVSEKQKLRNLFISRLYFLKVNSPEWAFKKILDFEEIKILFKGF